MDTQEPQLLQKRISRRDAIKAGGITALGLAFSKPVIETIHPRPASANLSPVGRCAVVEFTDPGTITGPAQIFIPLGQPSQTLYESVGPFFDCSNCGGLKCISEDHVENWRFILVLTGETVSPPGVSLSAPFGVKGQLVNVIVEPTASDGELLHLTSDRVVRCFQENCEPDIRKETSPHLDIRLVAPRI
ncbi:MAG: hypothetical protein ACE5Q6_13670 [Dehalococcoidia bacterium]